MTSETPDRIALPTCPGWCTRDHTRDIADQLDPDGPAFGDDPALHHLRVGQLSVDSGQALVSIDQQVGNPSIWIEAEAGLTPEQARDLAALLLRAAKELEGIAGL